MMQHAAQFDADGLDSSARACVDARLPMLRICVRQWMEEQLLNDVVVPTDDVLLRHMARSCDTPAPHAVCTKLADMIGLPSAIRTTQLLSHRMRGTFPAYAPPPGRRVEPLTDGQLHWLQSQVETIINATPYRTQRVAALLNGALCHDEASAQQLTDDLDKTDWMTAAQAQRIIESWLTHGSVGALLFSSYPYGSELLMLEGLFRTIERGVQSHIVLPKVQAILRADMIALLTTLHTQKLLDSYRTKARPNVQLYDQSLFHTPPNDPRRQRYRDSLTPELRTVIITMLAAVRGCDADTATHLFNSYTQNTLRMHIEWRHSQYVLLTPRLNDTPLTHDVEQLLSPLHANARTTILRRLQLLQDAIHTTGGAFSITPFIYDLPHSSRRRRRQRRPIPPELVHQYSSHLQMAPPKTRALLKRFMIYGLLGLLPIKHWAGAFHPRLWSYMWAVKLGRLEDTIDRKKLTELVGHYACGLGERPPSRQFVTAVCDHFAKDAYYNSGDGTATAGIPLRKSLKLNAAYRFLEQWVTVQVQLKIAICDYALHRLSETCIATIVFDCASACPLGVWVNHKPDGVNDLGLALYCAIWHRDDLQWPIRGLPEAIRIPSDIAGHDLPSLKRAATWMMAELRCHKPQKAILKEFPRINEVLRQLHAQYRPTSPSRRVRAFPVQMTQAHAQAAVRAWLKDQCFPNHRSVPPRAALRTLGVALPGCDTPMAGWLLPVAETHAPSIRSGVVYRNHSYADPHAPIEPGTTLMVRALTTDAVRTPLWVFAGDASDEHGLLHCLSHVGPDETNSFY